MARNEAAVVPQKTRKKKKFNRAESITGIICSSPFIFGFLMFMVVPMGLSLYYSLCDYDILSSPKFIGFDNYVKLFTGDSRYITSLKVTFFYALVSTPLRLIFALIVAMILVKPSKLSAFYRAVYYLPSIIGGSVAVSILWKRMFAKDGVVNALIRAMGGAGETAWLGQTNTAIWTLILLAVWQFGSSMLVFLSAIKQIPGELLEAAEVDGANGVQKFFKIQLPLLTPTIFFNLVMQLINGFLAFTQSYIITQGKPLDSTLFYVVYMYQQSFEFYHVGYGAAMAWVMLLIVAGFTALLFATKRFWVYDDEA